ncbi:MAG: acyl carrier protein [Gaiellaceae bacterium]
MSVETAAGIIRRHLGSRAAGVEIDASSRLDDLGLSSLEVAEAFFDLEEVVGYDLDASAAADVRTVGDLVAVVNELGQHDVA